MDALAALDEQQIDALLAGQVPPGTDLGCVSEVVRSLRAAAQHEPVPAMSPRLHAQLTGRPQVADDVR